MPEQAILRRRCQTQVNFRLFLIAAAALAVVGLIVGCGGEEKTFYIAGIPDQKASELTLRYETLTDYLSEELDVTVEYIPTVDYAATVTGFSQNDIQMAWFGALTGVQARSAVPGSLAIAQRNRDQGFHSKFIVQADLDVNSLEDLRGKTFTFGSESSTSGHLMPRFHILEAGIDPNTDFNGPPNFSGSHDKTWALVESGAFEAGALSEAVWDRAVAEGSVDASKVREFSVTPPYYNYNWTIRGDVDEEFGDGFTEKVRRAILSIGEDESEILDLFSAQMFVESDNSNYEGVRVVAEDLGIIR